MNIFVTSSCPIESAKFLDDKRVVKMCLESAQMLSTALAERGVVDSRLYKPTHKNHPCNVWTRETRGNFFWLFRHFQALLAEYSRRYGKLHASSRLVIPFIELMHSIPEGELTAFVNCAANKEHGLDYKSMPCVFGAYKGYLLDRWERDMRTPTWYGQPGGVYRRVS